MKINEIDPRLLDSICHVLDEELVAPQLTEHEINIIELEAGELRQMVSEAGSALSVLKGLKALPDNDQWEDRHEVESRSSGRKYVVSRNKKHGHWGCSCRGWTMHGQGDAPRKNCKHLDALGLNSKMSNH